MEKKLKYYEHVSLKQSVEDALIILKLNARLNGKAEIKAILILETALNKKNLPQEEKEEPQSLPLTSERMKQLLNSYHKLYYERK